MYTAEARGLLKAKMAVTGVQIATILKVKQTYNHTLSSLTDLYC